MTILGSGNTNVTGVITAMSTAGAAAGGLTLGTAGTAAAYSGTTTLSAAETYTGNTTINSGALTFSATQNLAGGLIIGSLVTNTAASTVNLTSANATFTSLFVNTNSASPNTIAISAGNSLNIVNPVAGATTSVQIGATTPTVANTVTNVTMNGGGSFNVTALGVHPARRLHQRDDRGSGHRGPNRPGFHEHKPGWDRRRLGGEQSGQRHQHRWFPSGAQAADPHRGHNHDHAGDHDHR